MPFARAYRKELDVPRTKARKAKCKHLSALESLIFDDGYLFYSTFEQSDVHDLCQEKIESEKEGTKQISYAAKRYHCVGSIKSRKRPSLTLN